MRGLTKLSQTIPEEFSKRRPLLFLSILADVSPEVLLDSSFDVVAVVTAVFSTSSTFFRKSFL